MKESKQISLIVVLLVALISGVIFDSKTVFIAFVGGAVFFAVADYIFGLIIEKHDRPN